jgi:hypothetical protein
MSDPKPAGRCPVMHAPANATGAARTNRDW